MSTAKDAAHLLEISVSDPAEPWSAVHRSTAAPIGSVPSATRAALRARRRGIPPWRTVACAETRRAGQADGRRTSGAKPELAGW